MGKRKAGLFLPTTKVEVEPIKKAHRKLCACCEMLPIHRRLKIVQGSGRSATMKIYCIVCGASWLRLHRIETDRAIEHLISGNGDIRLR
jgi:hypothetical protein